jgi:hypothetical protein
MWHQSLLRGEFKVMFLYRTMTKDGRTGSQDYKLGYVREEWVDPAHNTFYNRSMARGWESKSVESQMESKVENSAKPRLPLTDADKQVQRELQGLMLSRAYVLKQIESSSNERYKESLRQALSELDQKIARLEGR